MKLIAKESIGSLVTKGKEYECVYQTNSDFIIIDDSGEQIGFNKDHFTNKDITDAPQQYAKSVYGEFYQILFDSESDKGQEILVSHLAKECTKLAVKLISKEVSNYTTRSGRNGLNQIEFFNLVKETLK